jgi:hypothetical protein
LERLERWLPKEQRWYAPERFSPLTLAWSANDGGGAAMSIGPLSSRACDLICYERQDARHATILAADHRLREQHSLRFGTWRAHVRFDADGYLPFDVEATFVWEGAAESGVSYRRFEFVELRSLGTPATP